MSNQLWFWKTKHKEVKKPVPRQRGLVQRDRTMDMIEQLRFKKN